MRKELVVAEKEFRDYFTSKRFLMLFAILMLLAIVGMVSGMDNYHQQLDQYKKTQENNAKDPNRQQYLESLQQQLQSLKDNGGDQEEIERLQYQIEDMTNPIMPSIISIFYSISNPFYMIGMILAVAMGFDLIAKEKDEGSLKCLLSHPIYRDSVINGKAIAAIATLSIVLAATFLVSFAFMLFNGIVPQGDDLMRLIMLYIVSLLYLIVFFAIAMMISTIAKSSSAALLISMGIIVVLYVLPSISWPVTQMIIGPYPQFPDFVYDLSGDPQQQEQQEQLYKQYQQQQKDYNMKQRQINDIINGISPQYQYSQLTRAISTRQDPNWWGGDWTTMIHKYKNMTVWQSLSYEWVALLVIIVETIVAFAVSYVKFMRMDIR